MSETPPTARETVRQILEHDRESWSRLDSAVILAARVEAVLALHPEDHYCASCSKPNYAVPWPCPTMRVLNGGQP